MIEFKQVSKRYASGQTALADINLRIERGEMAFITGHSGAGKSTLLKLIGLIEPCTQGQLLLSDKRVNDLSRRQIPYLRRTMGMVFQNSQLLFDRTVFDNVALPLIISGFRWQEIPRRVRAALDKVGLLKKEKFHPHSLSCGEQQRIGIARAVVHKPRMLLADEPTGNLDPSLSAEIMNLFEQFNQVGVTVLVASHDVGLLAGMSQRILTLREGKLI